VVEEVHVEEVVRVEGLREGEVDMLGGREELRDVPSGER